MKNLSLNGVKKTKLEQLLVAGMLQRGNRQGVKVKELGVRGVEFGEDEVLE